jgi:ion channel
VVSRGALERRRLPAALARFWADDKGLSVFSGLLFLVTFVVPPLVPSGRGRGLVADIAYALLLLSGAQALGGRVLGRAVLMPIAVVTIGIDFASRALPIGQGMVQGTRLLSLCLLLALVLAQTLRAGPVNFHRLQGAVAAYLLLGVIWAHAYSLTALLRPAAFSGAVGSAADGPRAWLYYSFVTLTTVGYGDVLPVHPAARSLAMLEAVTGPLYLAILVARLVSLTTAVPLPVGRP